MAHYLSAQAEWSSPDKAGKGQPVMWIRGQTYADKIYPTQMDVLPMPW